MKLQNVVRRSLVLISIFSIICAQLVLVGSVRVVHADGTGNAVYGGVVDMSRAAVAGATVTIKNATDSLLAQGVTDGTGYYVLNGVPAGFGYILSVEAPAGSDFVPYAMDLDVMGDTSLETYPVFMHNSSYVPSTFTYGGKVLYDDNVDRSGTIFKDMYLEERVTNGVATKLNIDRNTGEFKTTMPAGDNYEMWQQPVNGFDPFSTPRGIKDMNPKVSIHRDAYKVYNFKPTENTIDTAVRVTDQCNNPLESANLYITRWSRININGSSVTASVSHKFGSEYPTDTDGRSLIKTQLIGEFGYLGVGYNDTRKTIILPDIMPSSISVQLNVPNCVSHSDTTAPALGMLAWSQNPKATTGITTLTVPATDDNSGIQKAEYFIGDTDPGQGNGATMQLSNVQNGGLSADLTTTFGTDFPTGVYKISVRAQDNAGNWSGVASDYLVVYDPAGPKMTGKRTIVPSLANGDILPGLTTTGQTDKAQFGFSVKYDNQGQINGNSDLQFSYSTRAHCNNPSKAVNCHDLSVNATNISWLVMQGTNNSTGIFQGTATMTADGQASTVLFRVTGVDGQRLSPTAVDQFKLSIYAANANPNTDTPIYQVNAADIARGNIKIQ